LDIKNPKEIRITISHATIKKSKAMKNEVENMSREFSTLKNQVKYYKGTQDALSKFIEDILKEDKINEHIRKKLYIQGIQFARENLEAIYIV
jgi:hypothetical protein